jgi:hypothetical protein
MGFALVTGHVDTSVQIMSMDGRMTGHVFDTQLHKFETLVTVEYFMEARWMSPSVWVSASASCVRPLVSKQARVRERNKAGLIAEGE